MHLNLISQPWRLRKRFLPRDSYQLFRAVWKRAADRDGQVRTLLLVDGSFDIFASILAPTEAIIRDFPVLLSLHDPKRYIRFLVLPIPAQG